MKSSWNCFESFFFDAIFSWPLVMNVRKKHRIVPYKIEGSGFLKILFYFNIVKTNLLIRRIYFGKTEIFKEKKFLLLL